MADKKVIDVILHCQKQLKKDRLSEEKLLHYLGRLSRLRITVPDLAETGIGRTVNSLSRIDGSVGQAADTLVRGWKRMVSEQQSQEAEQNESEDDESDSNSGSSEEEDNNKEDDDSYEIDERVESNTVEQYQNGNSSQRPAHSSETHNDFGDDENDDMDDIDDPYMADGYLNMANVHTDEENDDEDEEENDNESEASDSLQIADKVEHEIQLEDHLNEDIKPNIYVKQEPRSPPMTHDDKAKVHKNIQSRNFKVEDVKPNIYVKQELQSPQLIQDDKAKKMYKSIQSESRNHDEESASSKSHRHHEKIDTGHSSKEHSKDHKHHKSKQSKEHRSSKHSGHDVSSKSHSHSSKSNDKEKISSSKDHDKHHRSKESSSSSSHHRDSKSEKERSKEKKDSSNHNRISNSSSSSTHHHSSNSSSSKSRDPSAHSSKKSSPEKKLPDPNEERNRKDISDSNNSSSSSSKKSKLIIKNEIDSTSGVNFADVLGSLDASASSSSSKQKKSKKDEDKSQDRHDHRKKTNEVSTEGSSSKRHSKDRDRASSSSGSHRKNDKESESNRQSPSKKPSHVKTESFIKPIVNISPNYKPVYSRPGTSNGNSSAIPLSQAELSDLSQIDYSDFNERRESGMRREDDISSMLSSRSARSKVFSGVKSGRRGAVPSLFEQCMQVIKDNIGDLGYTGGIPFDILKPALERANPDQLFNIEDQNEYLIGETDELWEFHCKRDFRGQQPEETESWRELYERCKEGQNQRFERIRKMMKRKIDTAEPVRKAKLAYVESTSGPRFNKEKAQTIRNGMKTLKLKEEKGATTGVSSSASVGFNNPKISGDPTKVIVQEASVIIAPHSRAGHAPAPSVSRESSAAKAKPKKAPLMQKTMKLIRSLNRR